MAVILRQSTQIKVRIGVAVAVGDGFTPVTTLDLSTADEAELLKADGAATTDISGATFAAITGADGWYDLTLTTSHTDTVGELIVAINDDSLILPIFQRFQVIEEAVYDALYAASATGALPVSSGGIAASAFAAGAIDAAAIAAGAIDAATFAADVDAEILSYLVDDATRIDASALNTLSSHDPGATLGTSTLTQAQVTGGAYAINDPSFAFDAALDLTTAQKASVNAEVVDGLNVDTYAEPGQGNPAATASLVTKIGFVYKAWRNKVTETATTFSLYADDGTTVDQKATVSDNGTTYTRGEIATGP